MAGIRSTPNDNPNRLEGTGPKSAEKLMRKVGNTPVALCTHGDIVPGVLNRLANRGTVLENDLEFEKGSIWAVDVVDGEFPAARYIAPFA